LEEAAVGLQNDLDGGAEVPFELATQGSRRHHTPLYCYRPLTSAFIQERAARIASMPSHTRAARLLEDFDGLDRYLLARDVQAGRTPRRERANAALRSLLGDVFADQTDFELREERIRDALNGLEESAIATPGEMTLVATLHGLTIASPELALAPGLLIARPTAMRGLPEGAINSEMPDEAETPGHLLVMFTADSTEGDGPSRPHRDLAGATRQPLGELEALAEGRAVLAELLRALRLFGDGRITLGSLAWARVGAGSWNTLALGTGGRPHGMLSVSIEQEDELRAFCNLVSRRSPRDNHVAWALNRFEMGCERHGDYEALSDYLLALRALLEPEGSSSGLLPERLAALCATPERWDELSERVFQALRLEATVIDGTAVVHAGGKALVRDMADHLRALLRDVVCGHLDSDLAVVADELLASAEDQPPEAEDQPLERHEGSVNAPEHDWQSVDVLGHGVPDDDPWETDQLQLAGLPG
jgi:hypothetical protein